MSLKTDNLNSLKCYITQSQEIYFMLDIILKRFVVYPIYLGKSKNNKNSLFKNKLINCVSQIVSSYIPIRY